MFCPGKTLNQNNIPVLRETKTFHWAWIILGTCFVNLFINYSVRLGYSVVLPEMIDALGFSRTVGGSIFNAYFLSYIALTPVAGYLTDRIGARKVITSCAFFLGAGAILSHLSGRGSPEVRAAVAAFREHQSGLEQALLSCQSGRELEEWGYREDVAVAAMLDVSTSVPGFDGVRYRNLG